MTTDKVVGSTEEAIARIPDGASIAVGGFGAVASQIWCKSRLTQGLQ